MKKNEYAIEVKNLSKSFKLPTEKSSGLKQAIFNSLKGIKGYTKQEVLKDISFKVKKGEFFDQALKREFIEETGLEINIDSLYNVIQNDYTACKTNEKVK